MGSYPKSYHEHAYWFPKMAVHHGMSIWTWLKSIIERMFWNDWRESYWFHDVKSQWDKKYKLEYYDEAYK